RRLRIDRPDDNFGRLDGGCRRSGLWRSGRSLVALGLAALPEPRGLLDGQPEALARRSDFQSKLIRVHSLPKLDTEGLEAFSEQLTREREGGAISRGVVVVGDEHALHAVLLEGVEVQRQEAINAVGRDYVAESGGPEGERVDQRFAEDDLTRALHGCFVED